MLFFKTIQVVNVAEHQRFIDIIVIRYRWSFERPHFNQLWNNKFIVVVNHMKSAILNTKGTTREHCVSKATTTRPTNTQLINWIKMHLPLLPNLVDYWWNNKNCWKSQRCVWMYERRDRECQWTWILFNASAYGFLLYVDIMIRNRRIVFWCVCITTAPMWRLLYDWFQWRFDGTAAIWIVQTLHWIDCRMLWDAYKIVVIYWTK